MRVKRFLVFMMAFCVLFSVSALSAKATADRGSQWISENTSEHIRNINEALNTVCSGEIIVTTLDTCEEDLLNYAQEVFDGWNFEEGLRENSVLVVIEPVSSQSVMICGQSVKRFIKDNNIESITDGIDEYCSAGDFDGAAKFAVDETVKFYKLFYGEALSEALTPKTQMSTTAKVILIVLAVLIVVILAGVLWHMRARGKKWRWISFPGNRIFTRMDMTIFNDPNFWAASRKNRSSKDGK